MVDALKVSPPALLASITGFWMPALFGDVLEPTHIRNNILYRHIAMYLTVLSNGRRRNRSPTYLRSPQSRGIAVLGEFNFDFIFCSLSLLFTSFRGRRQTVLCQEHCSHAEWHHPCQPYQLTCSLKWPHSIPLPLSRADCDNPSS